MKLKLKQFRMFFKVVYEDFFGWLLIILAALLVFLILHNKTLAVSKEIIIIFSYFTTFYSWQKAIQEWMHPEKSIWEKSKDAMLYSMIFEFIAGMFLIVLGNKALISSLVDFSQSYRLWAVNIVLIILPLGLAYIKK